MTEAFAWLQEKPLGVGLLPKDWGADRNEAMRVLTAAYAQVEQAREENYEKWHAAMSGIVATLQRQFTAVGLEAAPGDWEDLWARIDLWMPSRDGQGHAALVNALFTDYSATLGEHIRYKVEHNANVHIGWTGPPGMAKSSMMLALMHWIKPIPKGGVVARLAFHPGEIAEKLPRLERGDTICLDEELASTGTGSRTESERMQNMENTLRASGRNLFWASPDLGEHATMQYRLEAIAWNPKEQWGVCIAWKRDQPRGLVACRWAEDWIWEEYCPWKEANVERTLNAAFKDNAMMARMVMAACEIKSFASYLIKGANKPKKQDFEVAVAMFVPQQLAGTQERQMVDFMHRTCYEYHRLEEEIEGWLGGPPSEAFLEIAKKCYKE